MAPVIGVDVGGTNITAGLVDADFSIIDEGSVDTPTGGPRDVAAAIVGLVTGLGDDFAAVGLGVPGPVRDGILQTAPNLRGFVEPTDLAGLVHAAIERPVVLGNDATLGTLGEAVAGAARHMRSVLGVWVGTGIGGGLVLDQQPYDGAFGSAGEFGHLIIRADGQQCDCGLRGCVEAYAGRRAMGRSARVAADAGHPTDLFRIMERKGKTRITSGVWKSALKADDPVATRIIADAIEALGIAIGSAVNLLDVECVVVGGGLAEKLGQPYVDRLRAASEPWMMSPHTDRRMVVASLGDHSGIVGAAASARFGATPTRGVPGSA